MVLTQSCDLAVRGDDAGKAPYINIAPVRPLEEVVSREITNLQLAGIRGELPLLTHRSRSKLVISRETTSSRGRTGAMLM